MADETAVQATPADVQATEATNTTPTPDATGKQAESATFTQAQVDAIIKDRLDRAERKAQESAKKAATDAEAKALAEQGKFKELYEKALAEASAAQERAKALELATLKRDIAARIGLPAGLAARLQGDDEAAIEADAKAMLELLPKPAAPNINAASGTGGVQPGTQLYGGLTEQEFASIYGVDPKYLNK